MTRRGALGTVAIVAVVAVLSLSLGSAVAFTVAEQPIPVECTVQP